MAQTTITKTIDQGDSITIQATPNENYSFGGWSFDNNTTINTNPYTYTPNSSDDIEAIFNITDPLVVVCSDKEDTVGRYLYLVNKNDQVKYWYLQTGTNTYTGNDPGWELDNIKTFYGDTYYPRSSKPSVDGKVGANHIISIDAHSLVNVEYLPDTAFFRQLALTSITLPLYLREVGDGQYCTTGTTYRGVFEECTSLSTVNWGNDTTTVGKISWIKKIWNYAFYKCNLSSITIPTYNLDSTDPNSNDLELCDYCFGSNNLTSINFTNIYSIGRVRYIREGAFYNNINLTTFNIPNYGSILQGIGNNPFYHCKRLATFTQVNSSARFRKLGNNILDHTYAKLISGGCNMTIPTEIINPVFTIGVNAFRGMCQTSLKSFTLPDTVKVIQDSAFSDNPYLQQFLTTSNSELTTMQQLCFYGDTRLEKVELYSISQFGANASSSTAFRIFYGCTYLRLKIYIHTLTVPTLYTPTLETFPLYDDGGFGWTWDVYVEPGMLSSYASTSSVQYDWGYWYSQGRLKTRISVNSDVNPNNSGTISGGGDVDVSSTSGTNTTLTATNNRGYSFNNWTKNGVSMSSSNPYTFKVSDVSGGNFGTYIANFNTLQSYTISTSVNDNTYGSATGGGTYYSGESCTLTATPNTDYEFVNWTENGTTVSSNSTYTFTVSGNRTLVANFQAPAPPRTITAIANAADTYVLKNSSNQTYTWNLTSGTNTLTDGDISGFGFDNITSFYKYDISTTSYNGLTSLDISELTSMTSIPSYAFKNCRSLTSINIPTSITSIDYQAFYSCTGLTSINLKNTAVLGNQAFYNCTGLTEFKAKYITTLNSKSLCNLFYCSKIVLPSLQQVGSQSFEGLGASLTSSTKAYLKLGNYRNWYNLGMSYSQCYTGSLIIPNNAFGTGTPADNYIDNIYLDYCSGPISSGTTLSTAINSTRPNSSFIVHVDEDDIYDEDYWDNIKAIPAARRDEGSLSNMYSGEFD